MPRQSLFDAPVENMTYDMVDAFLIERHREDLRIEYKEPTRDKAPRSPDTAIETITSMSNGVGGIILVGVEEEGGYPKEGGWPLLPRVVGRSGQEDVITSKVASLITPRPLMQARFLAPDTSPDTGILVVTVKSGPRPPYWCASRGILSRIGEQDRIADLATIEHLLERRAGGNYTVDQARQHNWFASLGGVSPTDPTIVRAVVGPVDAVPAPPLSRSLDSWAWSLFVGDSRVPFWQGTEKTVHPSFGEDYVHFLVRTSERAPKTYEMRAYSNGITTWNIPLGPSDAAPNQDQGSLEAFRSEQLQIALYTIAALGIEWVGRASPDYQGALSYEAEVHNVRGKSIQTIRTGPGGGVQGRLDFSAPAWKGMFTLTDRGDYLRELKSLYYRFLRSGQVPALMDDADALFDAIDKEWREARG